MGKHQEDHFHYKSWLVIVGLTVIALRTNAQTRLSLDQALALARENNQWNKIAYQEQLVSIADYNDSRNAILPQITMGAFYQRFSKVTLFSDGLWDSRSITRIPGPNSAGTSVEASMNLYTGGRQKTQIQEQKQRSDLAALNLLEQESSISLQVCVQYFELVNSIEQQKLVGEQLARAETRLNNIRVLYKNTRVTRNDVLRSEVVLANVQLLAEKVMNDRRIIANRLKLLLNKKDEEDIVPTDSARIALPITMPPSADQYGSAGSSFLVRKAMIAEEISQTRLTLVRSNYRPTLALFGAYNLSYPNNLFFPPVDQAYSVGFVGLRVQYQLSSLYHNKYKESAATVRIQIAKQAEQNVADNVTDQITALYIKYQESLTRIAVAKRTIEQTEDNYRIVSTRYYNQLALLIDLLDADNLFQESKYSLVRAQVDALNYYHQLRFAQGTL
ncbi:Outer membrane protein TolC [Dyadobacter soli]|uniref:Outer membrane protein TolC n=2 Tax=Dyadobacter soli TaxID=659014 RepID=A0A1G6VKN8_9BACT|nr:Outer membrane protein TolC [Dyadobacter soli]